MLRIPSQGRICFILHLGCAAEPASAQTVFHGMAPFARACPARVVLHAREIARLVASYFPISQLTLAVSPRRRLIGLALKRGRPHRSPPHLISEVRPSGMAGRALALCDYNCRPMPAHVICKWARRDVCRVCVVVRVCVCLCVYVFENVCVCARVSLSSHVCSFVFD